MINSALRIVLSCTLILSSIPTWGQSESEDQGRAQATEQTRPSKALTVLDSIDYPELQVVPRASDRLKMEADWEKRNHVFVHWPFYLSALTTIYASETMKGNLDTEDYDEQETARDLLGVSWAIGAAWFVGMFALSFDKPYEDALDQIKNIKGKDRQATLLRERLAEEQLQQTASLMKKLTYMSVATNAVANLIAIDKLNSDGRAFALVGFAAAFAPLLFTHRYIQVYEKHEEYKRKIYAPTVLFDFHKEPLTRFASTSPLTPKLSLVWSY